MSMGQQLGSATAGMTPAAGNKALPGAQPGKPPANQLQQAMMPTTAGGPQASAAPPPLMGTMRPGQGPVAPQPMQPQFENRALNQSGAALAGAQSYSGKPQAQNVNSVGLRSIGAFNGPAVPGGMRR